MRWGYYFSRLNRDTVGRYDVTPLFADPSVFSNLISDLLRQFSGTPFEKVVGIDALGFVLAGAIALRAKKPLALIRKGGKLPLRPKELLRASFTDYSRSRKTFEMSKSAISRGDRVLIVDEWIETGAQVMAAIRLVERAGGTVVGIAAISCDRNRNTAKLLAKYNCKTLNNIRT